MLTDGTEIPYTLLPCSNSTHAYLYFTYSHSTEEVVIIPESLSSIAILPLMTAALLAVINFKKKTPKRALI